MLPFILPTARCEPITCSSVVLLLKVRADLLTLELVVLVAPDGDRGAKRFERAGQPLGAGAKCQRMTPRRQLQRAAFDDRNAVFRVVVAVARADVRLLAGPSRADVRERAARVRVQHLALAASAKSSERRPPPPMLTANLPLPSCTCPAPPASSAAVPTSNVTSPDAPLNGPRRNLVRDDVDETADGIRAVQQRGRPAHHFDAFGSRGIDG